MSAFNASIGQLHLTYGNQMFCILEILDSRIRYQQITILPKLSFDAKKFYNTEVTYTLFEIFRFCP